MRKKNAATATPDDTSTMGKRASDTISLRRTATEVKKYAVLMKASTILLASLVGLVSAIYAISYFYDKYGSFTVSIDKYDMVRQGLSLSETPEFDEPISRLNANAIREMTNISEYSLPKNVDAVNGTHNGTDYIAYTFYMKNTGQETVSVKYGVYLSNITLGIDEAIRFRLYEDGVPTTYAKTKSDGTGAEEGTVEFLSAVTVMQNKLIDMAPGTVHKYTAVIWLEGNDPDCVDSIVGGKIKMEMDFEIFEAS